MEKTKVFKDKNEYLWFEKYHSDKDVEAIKWWFNDCTGYYEGIVYDKDKKQIGDFRFSSWETMEQKFPKFQFDYGK